MSESGDSHLMGDIAEMILNGVLCEICGTFIDGDATMYPRPCEECKEIENAFLKKGSRG